MPLILICKMLKSWVELVKGLVGGGDGRRLVVEDAGESRLGCLDCLGVGVGGGGLGLGGKKG